MTRSSIAFLLGAGTSLPAGLPSTTQITEEIVRGDGIMRRSDGNYYLGVSVWRDPNVKVNDDYVPRVKRFTNLIKGRIEEYYSHEERHQVDYEEIYYVISQIRDNESGEYENPALLPFIEGVRREAEDVLGCDSNATVPEWTLARLAYEASNYIGDALWHLLYKKPTRVDHLRVVIDACLDEHISRVDLFTLNHDTVLEQALVGQDIKIVDGFDSARNNVRYWKPELFEKTTGRVYLLKLHGSINWFRFIPESGGWDQEMIGIPLEWDFWHTKGVKGERQWPVDGRPLVLAGTFNKMLDYTRGMFADLHGQFRRMLRRVNHLVVSGYGFRDKGINSQIIEWLYGNSHHCITVIHPDGNSLKSSARGAVSQKWEEWIHRGRLRVYPALVQDTSWEDLRGLILLGSSAQ